MAAAFMQYEQGEQASVPTCLAPGEKPRYEPVLAGPHLMGKFRRSVTL
jgi:hypothetical protein